MIDKDILESYDPPELVLALKQCFATLHSFGVFEQQLQREKEKLLSGDRDESDVDLAKSILAYRTTQQQLLVLDDLGRTCARELGNDEIA